MNNKRLHMISAIVALCSAGAMYFYGDSFSVANRLRYGDISYRDFASALNSLIVAVAFYWVTRFLLVLVFGKSGGGDYE